MTHLIMCRGLPASGKTTWALDEWSKNPAIVVIDSDVIRQKMGGYNETIEDLVQLEKFNRIKEALKRGKIVISADPNLLPMYESKLRSIAKQCKATFEIHSFDTPVEECIRRDALRKNPVGKEAIIRMSQYSVKKSK